MMTTPVIAGAYLRKSNEEGTKAADVKSVAVQKSLAVAFALRQGWTLDDRYVYADDGISGAEFTGRPGLQAMLAALAPSPPFGVIIVSDQDRLGRETLDTLVVVRQIEDAGVKIFSVDGRRITLSDENGEIMTMLDSWRGSVERKKTATRVRRTAFERHDRGYVPGGKTFGYRNVGEAKSRRREVHEPEAVIVRRIFASTVSGYGLARISKQLNAEGLAAPRDAWSPTGVREILRRTDYKGLIVLGRTKRDRVRGKKIRERLPESEWKTRRDESLRIVSDAQWSAAHAQTAATAAQYLRRGNQLLGKVENVKGKFLLSGFLACGADAVSPRAHGGTECGAPLVALQRGRNLRRVYVCQAHRNQGDAVCTNSTAVPMDQLHSAVVQSLRETLTPAAFEDLLKRKASDEGARAERQAERERLLAEIPKLAATEAKLARLVATVEDVDALVAELKTVQASRREGELRVAELEGVERDLRADEGQIERLRTTLPTWLAALDDDPILARQILRKVVAATIAVYPRGEGAGRYWTYSGVGAYDGVLAGSVDRESAVAFRRLSRPLTIAGGSDAPAPTGGVGSDLSARSGPPMY